MKNSLVLGGLAAIQVLAALAFQFVVMAMIGAGPETDMFIAAQAVPLVLQAILAIPMQNVWLPRLSVLSNDRDDWCQARDVAQTQTFLLFMLPVLLLALLAPIWVHWAFPGFGHSQVAKTVGMTQLLLASSVLNGQIALLTVVQRSRHQFIGAEAILAVTYLVALVMLYVTLPKFGIQAAVWASVMRSLASYGLLQGMAGLGHFRISKTLITDKAWGQVGPLLAGASVYKMDPIIDRYWSSHSPAGGMTVLGLAQACMSAIATVLERIIVIPVLPDLARLAAAGDFRAVRTAYRKCISRATWLWIPLAIMAFLGYPLWIKLLMFVFNMPQPAAEQFWVVCACLLGFLYVASCGAVSVSAFYALGITRIPALMSVVAFGLGVVLKFAAFPVLSLAGLAIATSIYYLFNLVAVCVLLERHISAQLH